MLEAWEPRKKKNKQTNTCQGFQPFPSAMLSLSLSERAERTIVDVDFR